jgi:undecaprenyl-diphosphatase
MDPLSAVIVGSIQGFAEWLPISSEAQTMLYMINVLGIAPETALSYSIFLHCGTMIAVLIALRKEFINILRNLNLRFPLTRNVVLATLATALTGIPLYLLLKGALSAFRGIWVNLFIGLMLIATGLILHSVRDARPREMKEVHEREFFVTGLAQGCAILPGISRSGVTLASLLSQRIEQETALRISFLLSVPAVLGAVILDSPSITMIPAATALLLTLASLVTGYLSMQILLAFSRRVSFWIFCIVFGTLTIAITGTLLLLVK